MDIHQIQEALLGVLPYWNYQIAKPFKQMLDEGVSLEMYYCIQALRWSGGVMTMSALAAMAQIPKQQMTKLVNRLVECGFVERADDPADRRIVNIKLTAKAMDYIAQFLEQDAGCFRRLLEQMDQKDRDDFGEAIETLLRILPKIPSNVS